MQIQHVLKSKQFDFERLQYIFRLSNQIRKIGSTKAGLIYLRGLLADKRAMLFFSQPSTRTFLSFQSACHILGIQTSEIRDPSTSSEAKGETIEDSLRTFASYVDLIIMRSEIAGLCDRLAELLSGTKQEVPIINAGSGPDEHPTQALLDLYTLGEVQNKTICMVGDLKRGRTVRSLSQLLCHFNGVKIIFCSPPEFAIQDDLRTTLKNAQQISFIESQDFLAAITEADAIYMTRIQDEYDNAGLNSSSVDTKKYNLKVEHLDIIKPTCKILHPMPRRQELDSRIDQDPRAYYWQQQRNGMWLRTALIAMLLGVDQALMLYAPAELLYHTV